MILIKPVTRRKELKAFIRLPWKIYQNDPHWCPPFLSECKKMFSGKHPFYDYGEMKLFVAEKDGEIVGRIAGIKNRLHNQQYNDRLGFFGFFECIDDQRVANALLDAAKEWLKSQGCDRMRGPASPSANYDYGCQYTGFEYDQVLLSTHNAPYYFKLLENYGLRKEIDLFAYKFTRDVLVTPTFKAINRYQEKHKNYTIRHWNKDNPKNEIFQLKRIFNESWAKNHGFIPITDKEAQALYDGLKPLFDPHLMLFAEKDGELIGGSIYIQDYNQLFRKMGGRLFPWDLCRIYMKKRTIEWQRVLILGVLPQYHHTSIFPSLFCESIKQATRVPQTKHCEASYILENNLPMITAIEKIGGEIYKKYRVFEMSC